LISTAATLLATSQAKRESATMTSMAASRSYGPFPRVPANSLRFRLDEHLPRRSAIYRTNPEAHLVHDLDQHATEADHDDGAEVRIVARPDQKLDPVADHSLHDDRRLGLVGRMPGERHRLPTPPKRRCSIWSWRKSIKRHRLRIKRHVQRERGRDLISVRPTFRLRVPVADRVRGTHLGRHERARECLQVAQGRKILQRDDVGGNGGYICVAFGAVGPSAPTHSHRRALHKSSAKPIPSGASLSALNRLAVASGAVTVRLEGRTLLGGTR
jgi:hypothetical protein